MEDGPVDIVSGQESIIERSYVRREICEVSDQGPVVVPRLATVPLAVPVVVQTRPQVGCGPDLPLPVDQGLESLDDEGLDVFFSGRESTVKIPDVSHDILVEPDQCPVVVPKEAGESLALPVVALTRSQAGCAPVFTWPVNDDVARDGCHTEWRETVVDDMKMEKSVLVPEVCPVGSMTSAAGPTFLPALSEVYSLVFFWLGGSCCGKPPGGGRVRYSASVWPAGGVRYSASVCPASCRKRSSGGLCWEGHLGFGRFEGWTVGCPIGSGGNPAGFAE